MNLNQTEKAVKEFEYVINEGNTLRMKQQAIEYLRDLNSGNA